MPAHSASTNQALKVWGQTEINRIAREWAERGSRDNETVLEANDVYQRFRAEAGDLAAQRSGRVADRLIRNIIKRNPLAAEAELEQVVQLCLDFLKFDTFVDLAEKIAESADPMQVLDLFREWEVVEAHEMSRVTVGGIRTIEKLQRLIDEDALEVPTLHNFLKEFPWVIDPRWTLIADERRYSDMLREQFPDADEPEEDRRIDFLCVREGTHLVVVEIKRPGKKVSRKELTQIEEYVAWMREYVSRTTDPDMRIDSVEGYLLCGGSVDTPIVRQRIENLRRSQIYVRRYGDLLDMVRRSHAEFLTRYERIKALRAGESAARLAAGSGVAQPPREQVAEKVRPAEVARRTNPRVSWATSEATRSSMIANRARDTSPERSLRSALHRAGLRFRVCQRPVRGVRRTADLLFSRARVAVFVDGCFWHGCQDHYAAPHANGEYWRGKVERTRERDRDTDRILTEAGWVVVRVWEHEPLEDAVRAVRASVSRAR